MQQVTRREAYELLKPVLADMEEEFYQQVKGRAVAKHEELDNGCATITLLGIDYPLFARDPDGTVHAYNYNGQRCNYSLFNSPHQRHVVRWVTALDANIKNRVFELAGQQPWFDTDSAEHNAAAARHAHRIIGRHIRPTRVTDRIRQLNKTLYRLYDPALFKLLMRVTSGYERDAHTYNCLTGVQNPHDVPPSVLAAYLNLARRDMDDLNTPAHRDPIQVTQYVREVLARHRPLRRAAWRYLLRLPPRHAAYIFERLQPTRSPTFLDLLAQTGETPRWTTLKMLVSHYGHLTGNRGDEFDETQFVQYARMLTRHTARMRGIKTFQRTVDHRLILDWLASGVTLTPTQAALPYTWWQQRAQEWHDDPNGPVQQRLHQQRAHDRYYAAEQAAIQPILQRQSAELAAAYQAATATYAVGEHQYKGITLTPLTTSEQLKLEGDRMGHCVGGYAGAVLRGVSRIYHLEGHGARSTIELRHDYDRWRINQHHGPKNCRPSEEHLKTGRALLRKYNETHPQPHEDLLAALEERYRQEIQEARTRAIQQATTAELAARGTPPRHAAPANHPAQATH